MTTDVAKACHIDFPKYVIGSDGSVVSHVHSRARKLKPIKRARYFGFSLLDANGNVQAVYHHRIVTETFHGACPEDHETRHLDGSRDNNSADNLCWGTRTENMRDKERHGTAPIGSRHGGAKLDELQVSIMRRLHRRGITPSALMRYFGVSRMTVSRVVNRKLWSHVP